MERLTAKQLDGKYHLYEISKITKTTCCDESGKNAFDLYEGTAIDKLGTYEDAEEQGLLLRLPCKIGRKVFYVQKCLAPSCKECKGFLRVDNCYCQYKARIFEQKFDYRHLQAFGKSVFLTKEQALARMEDNNGKHEN